MRIKRVSLAAIALLLMSVVAAAGPASAAVSPILCIVARRPAAGGQPAGSGPEAPAVTILAQPGQAYIHTSTNNNDCGDSSYLDNPALNDLPNAKFLVTQNSLPYGVGVGSLSADDPLGVWYDSSVHRWAIYNDDLAGMTARRAWNVFIPPQDGTLNVHESNALNDSGPETLISDPQLNDNPSAVVFVQHVYDVGAPAAGQAPQGFPSNYYTRTVAVAYDAGAQQWAIRNEDGSSFPPSKTFYVLQASADESFFTQTVTAGNAAFGYATQLDSPLLNGNPDAQILITQNFGTGVANNHRVGVAYYYPTQRWYIFNQDVGAMPLGAMFNVLVIPPKTGYLLQTATLANTTLNATAIDNPVLNNNPDALIYVSHNWNPPESDNEIYNDHPLGVQYIASAWNVVNVDGAPMPLNATFNVYYTLPRGNSFSVSASAYNASGSSMNLNSPLLNSSPAAVAIASYNVTPAGLAGGIYTPTIGLRYYSPLSDWQIFNYSGPTFNNVQSYNVLVPGSPAGFVVTATAPVDDYFDIDNPLTNNNPAAMVFATERDSGSLNPKNVGVFYHSGTHRWAIFNEDQSSMAAGLVYDVFVSRLRIFAPIVMK